MNTSKLQSIQRCLKTCVALQLRIRGFQTSQKTLQKEIYADVVIAGGGMVGTSLCCALGSSEKFANKKVILLEAGSEQSTKNWQTSPFENRVSSITPGSTSFLDDAGIWKKILKRRYHPYEDMHVWDGVAPGSIDLNSSDVDAKQMAYIVENSVIVESCMERARELSDIVQIEFDARVSDVYFPFSNNDCSHSDLVKVKLENGDIVKAKLLVGADGPTSFIRGKADIKTYDYDYGQNAVVATLNVRSQTSLNNTAWQRFLPTGPIALLPLSHDCSSLVWSTTKKQAKELVQATDEEFISKVNEAFLGQDTNNPMLGAATNLMKKFISTVEPGRLASTYLRHPPLVTNVYPRSRGMFPLALKHSIHYVKPRMALVGDAAHRIHPMAGLGVNLGFGDVKCLVDTMETAIDEGEDYGNLDALLPYETERQRHVVPVMCAINGLHTLFSTTMLPVVLARTFGLQATNSFNPVKDRIIKYAMQ